MGGGVCGLWVPAKTLGPARKMEPGRPGTVSWSPRVGKWAATWPHTPRRGAGHHTPSFQGHGVAASNPPPPSSFVAL